MKKLTNKQISLIKQKIKIKNNLSVVRLKMVNDKAISEYDSSHNVFCVDDENNIIWQIQFEETGFGEESFVSIGIGSDGKLHAINFSGFNYIINTETGIATRTGWNK